MFPGGDRPPTEVKFGVWRCAICGEVYFGEKRPSQCPNCGSAAENLVRPDAVLAERDNISALLTAVESKNLTTSVMMETGDIDFYGRMAKVKGPDDMQAEYEKLGKIEGEHQELFLRLLGTPDAKPKVVPLELGDTWNGSISMSIVREKHASLMYHEFALSATHPRLRQVWAALSRVEMEHSVFETEQLLTLKAI